MRKLIVALSAVVAVFVAKAATVDWSYKITGASANDAYSSGYTAYLFDKATWESNTGAFDKALDSSAIQYYQAKGRGTNVTYEFATANASGTTGATRDVSNADWGATHDFYVVLLNTAENKYVANAITMNTRGASDSAGTSGVFPTTQTALNGATWTTVPEPTSALLMMLGLAGLALKRKRV